MKFIKVKNTSNTTLVIPNGRGGDIILPSSAEAEIPEKYLSLYSGKIVPVKEDNEENSPSLEAEKNPQSEEKNIEEPTEEGTIPVEENENQQPEEVKDKHIKEEQSKETQVEQLEEGEDIATGTVVERPKPRGRGGRK